MFPSNALLRTENLQRHFQMGSQTVCALDGIDLTIHQGEFLALMGPSGSGKSTLLYLLGGLDRPTAGQIWVRNLGRDAVDVIGLRATGLNASLQSEGAAFVGPLDPGGSAPLDLMVTPSRDGMVQLNVHVEYRDDLNRPQMWTQALTFEVAEIEPSKVQTSVSEQAEEKGSAAFWQTVLRGLKGFVGFGS